MGKIVTSLRKLRDNKTLLHGAFFSLFSFINRGFIFLLLLILANYISPSEYGYLSLFSTVITVLGFFICLSSEGYMSVSYFQDGKDSLKYTYSTILIIGLLMSLILFFILLISGDTISSLLDLPLHILYISVFISLFTILANVNLDYFRLRERVTLYGIFSCSNALLNFIVSILLIKTFMLGWEGRAYAQMGCASLFGLFSVVYFLHKRCITWRIKDWVKTIIIWSLPLIPMHATNFIRQGVDRYIINYSHTIADVGLFSFALNISNIITMIGFGFNQSFSVDIYKILGSPDIIPYEKRRLLKKMFMRLLLFFIQTTIVLTIACYLIVPLLLPQYSQAMNYFVILSVYAFFVCYYLIFTNILFFYKKTNTIMILSVSTSILHILVSLIVTRYSLLLTCIAYCISQGLFALGVQYFSNKELKLQLR